ncbi:MAG: RagB/SusD family nutrient uptake outer membrane protein [Paludibacteraceae bacterium]|nr:RagB/SusD family nutrient uptake outer membrane protein [Paludibacteraceae bacterium]
MKTLKIFAAVFLSLWLTSCVQDLNTTPIDPNIKQEFDENQVYYKIYASLGTSGQKGPDGDCDIVNTNEGYTVWYRVIWMHNEYPCDGGWWIWNSDAGASDLLNTTWDASNPMTAYLYNRLIFNVTLCNHYLDNTGGNPEGLDEVSASDKRMHTRRAEIRMMRAMTYSYLVDFFGNPPFLITVNQEAIPEQHPGKRAGMANWVISELKACEKTLLPSEELTGSARFYRFSQDAATLLLARMYLNSEVYTGTAQWDSAAVYAKKIMDKYPIVSIPYKQLFMADNDNNAATPEIIFSIGQDGQQTQSWGGSLFCVAGSHSAKMNANGSTDSWECWRSSPELLQEFTGMSLAELKTIKGDETEMPKLLKDDRALFCNHTAGGFTATLGGVAEYGTGNFEKCWAICKWSGLKSNGEGGSHTQFPDTDLPIMRAAEAYLAYAEAQLRLGHADVALQTINDNIRARAHATKLTEITERVLLDEWQREFYSEGRRRSDMIRFGSFTGKGIKYNGTLNYHWEGRGKKPSGSITTIEDKYNLYPIPNSDRLANPNLKQNEGF